MDWELGRRGKYCERLKWVPHGMLNNKKTGIIKRIKKKTGMEISSAFLNPTSIKQCACVHAQGVSLDLH